MKLFEHKIELEKAIIIKRPSTTCKTPYVADIDLNVGSLVYSHVVFEALYCRISPFVRPVD